LVTAAAELLANSDITVGSGNKVRLSQYANKKVTNRPIT